ncbi:VOC family protein [Lentzea sp. BCCO 10_0798]|uniref:VOC family protein n=1 Tax=Lentzea kristufekii TaxID=3095430 RepID=A0ABU4TN77_9PSEU|nr:VOC family protein [Lentzea sp. BCCO 10_0798]MDX8049733.1 VOC family protein [Lentzea sp. BCCO 10_0798]
MCVSDLVRSLEWYGVFFGREADEIIGEEHLWQVGENAYIVLDARDVRSSRVGGSMVTFGVALSEFEGALERLAAHGVRHEPVETYSNGVRHVEVLDPDGNSLSLAALPQAGADAARSS